MAVETKEYRAEARFQRVSPQKARLVLDLIKGRGVQEALETAQFTKMHCSGDSQAADFGRG
jgi:large subunit ribosomal protein L22